MRKTETKKHENKVVRRTLELLNTPLVPDFEAALRRVYRLSREFSERRRAERGKG